MNRNLLVRIVIALSVVWLILLAVFYFHSKYFREHILDVLKPYLDERLTTEIHIQKENIEFTILEDFPNISVSLKNVFVKSANDLTVSEVSLFNKDTLLFAKQVRFSFNMKSLFQKEYELKKIELTDAYLNLLCDKYGKTNYTIFRTKPEDSLSVSFSVNLRKIHLENVIINYCNEKTTDHFFTCINKGDLSGNFNNQNFLIKAKTELSKTRLKMKHEEIFTDQSFTIHFSLNKEADVYSIRKGTLLFLGIKMSASGSYNTQNKQYQFLLSSQSAPLSKLDLPFLNTFLNKYNARIENGLIYLASSVSGYANGTSPAIAVKYKIEKGIVRFKDYEYKITDVLSYGKYSNGALRNNSSSVLLIDTLYGKSGKSNVSFSGNITNFSFPTIIGRIETDFELDKVSNFLRIPENYAISGFITGAVQFKFSMSQKRTFKSIDWNKSYFNGSLTIHEITLKQLNRNLPLSRIKGELKIVTISEVIINKLSINTGKTDLLIRGSIHSIPFLTGNKSVYPVFDCEILSDKFNTDDFLILNTDDKKEDAGKVVFPDSVIVYGKFRANDFSSGKFKATHVDGYLEYTPKSLTIKDFSMHTLEGTIESNLIISEINNTITAECKASLKGVDIGDLFFTFNNFRQDVIHSENLDGILSGTTEFTTAWDFNLNLIPEKIRLASQIRIDDGELINYEPLLGLSGYIKVEELKHIKFETLKTFVDINNMKVFISETDIHSSALSLLGSGIHGFDKKYTYRLQVQLSDVLWKKAKKNKPENTEFGYIVNDGYNRTMIPIIITGDENTYEVNYDKLTAKSFFKNKVQKEKEVLKELFAPEKDADKSSGTFKDTSRIEWEDFEEQEDTNLPGANEKKEEQEFQIEWEDD